MLPEPVLRANHFERALAYLRFTVYYLRHSYDFLMTVPFIEENDQTRARHEHLDALRELVGNVYPNKFQRSNVTETPAGEDTITSIVGAFRKFEPQVREGERPSADSLGSANARLNKVRVVLAGRIAAPPRVMGKAAFVHLSDGTSRLQIYVRRQDVVGARNDGGGSDVDGWELFGLLDHGDFIGIEGFLFVTKTGELSVHVEKLRFLAKALLPMPDKMHGIHDPEIRQRQRYADLIAGSLKLERDEDGLTPREVFELRSKVVREIRRFLDDRDFVEVETPMLTPLATGAAARPFKTHHNALDIDLYARIAPELYLKRLVVGGFEKVYELNRNFRNEGISSKHNPEFTMLEFYAAYMDVNGMMDLCEELLRTVVKKVRGKKEVVYNIPRLSRDLWIDSQPNLIDFSKPFQRLTMRQAVAKYWKPLYGRIQDWNVDEEWLRDPKNVRLFANFQREWYAHGVETFHLTAHTDDPSKAPDVFTAAIDSTLEQAVIQTNATADSLDEAKVAGDLVYLFEGIAEHELIQPTFITNFPKPISPLSKASPADPTVAERFEYFVGALAQAFQ